MDERKEDGGLWEQCLVWEIYANANWAKLPGSWRVLFQVNDFSIDWSLVIQNWETFSGSEIVTETICNALNLFLKSQID